MENDAFDRVTRAFMGTHPRRMTRRGMTRLMGGLALGGPLTLLGRSPAEAKCKKKCGPCKRCKQGKCKPKPAGTVCAGGTCQGGSCVPAAAPPSPPVTCPSGTSPFAGRCAPSCDVSCDAKAGFCATTFDGLRFCAPVIRLCEAIPQSCGTHADCAAQELCTQIGCGANGVVVSRCVPVLT